MIEGALTIREVNTRLKGVVEGGFPPVWVKAELAELKTYASGHWYFTLRDAETSARCVMWKASAARMRAVPTVGMAVVALARPNFYVDKGEFRWQVDQMLPTSGEGDAALALKRVREALERDGLLAGERKRPLPPFPMRVAIVTSLQAAALRDMVTVARRRWPAELLVVPASVQGEAAGRELVAALGRVGALGVEACIVGRGGGSQDDLAAFNLEAVCRAIAAVPVPVISAVGHETDTTLADLVADRRAETPTAAVELLFPDQAELRATLQSASTRLVGGLSRRTRVVDERLSRAQDRIQFALERRITTAGQRLDRLAAQLDALSPLKVLGRGYALPRDVTGRVLRRRAEFTPGLGFRLRVMDGEVQSRVEEA